MLSPTVPLPPPPAPLAASPSRRADPAALQAAAEALEAQFLSVMLQAAGFGAPRESFGGGAGEAQFASFLAEAQAAAMARRGGIGLSESLVRAMAARDGTAVPAVPLTGGRNDV